MKCSYYNTVDGTKSPVLNLTNNKIVCNYFYRLPSSCIPMLGTPFLIRYNTCKLYFSVNEIMLWFLFEIHVHCILKQFNSNSLIVPAQSTLGFCLISCPFEFPGLAGQFFKLSNVQGPLLNCGNF